MPSRDGANRVEHHGYADCLDTVFTALGNAMIATELRLPELALLVGTRGLLGAGIGLLVADKLSEGERRGIGWTPAAVGALTTIPLAMIVFSRFRRLP
jgi:hypothetical protein